jgi:hypothetical protein
MSSLEEQFEAACAAGELPGVVLIASDAKGEVFEEGFNLYALWPLRYLILYCTSAHETHDFRQV